jgi:hypothetical protein
VSGLYPDDERTTRGLCAHYSLRTVGFGTSVGHVISLPVEADDKHRAPVPIAIRLVGGGSRSVAALRSRVSDALSETAVAEPVGASKELDAVVGIVRS